MRKKLILGSPLMALAFPFDIVLAFFKTKQKGRSHKDKKKDPMFVLIDMVYTKFGELCDKQCPLLKMDCNCVDKDGKKRHSDF
jgi:hypothetical protein